jgi:hypothetical protein
VACILLCLQSVPCLICQLRHPHLGLRLHSTLMDAEDSQETFCKKLLQTDAMLITWIPQAAARLLEIAMTLSTTAYITTLINWPSIRQRLTLRCDPQA